MVSGPHRDLAAFFGHYTVARRIEDRRAGQTVRFEGRAQIAEGATPHSALYRETGEMRIPPQGRFTAERSYLWRAQAGRIVVKFDDGRPFHDFDPVSGGAATEHLCGQDWYLGGYDFSGWPQWSVIWEVSGPRKDYRSVTRYCPHKERRT